MCECVSMRVCMCVYVCVYGWVSVYVYVSIRACVCVGVYACVYVSMHVCMCVCVYACVCMCVGFSLLKSVRRKREKAFCNFCWTTFCSNFVLILILGWIRWLDTIHNIELYSLKKIIIFHQDARYENHSLLINRDSDPGTQTILSYYVFETVSAGYNIICFPWG